METTILEILKKRGTLTIDELRKELYAINPDADIPPLGPYLVDLRNHAKVNKKKGKWQAV